MSIDAFRFAQSAKAALKAAKPAYFRGAVRGVADAKFEEKTRKELEKQVCPEIFGQTLPDETPFSADRFRLWTQKLLTGLVSQLLPGYKPDEVLCGMVCEQFMTKRDRSIKEPCLKQHLDPRAIQAILEGLLREPCQSEKDARIVAYAFMEQTWQALLDRRLGPKKKSIEDAKISAPKSDTSKTYIIPAKRPLISTPPLDQNHAAENDQSGSSSYESSHEEADHDATHDQQHPQSQHTNDRPITGWEAMLKQIRQETLQQHQPDQ